MSRTTYLLIGAVIFFTTSIISLYLVYLDKQKAKKASGGTRFAKKGLISDVQYTKLYSFFDKNFLTSQGFRKVYGKVAELSIYSLDQIRKHSVLFYGISLIAFWGMILVGTILFRDLFTVLLIALYGIVLKDTYIYGSIDKIHFKVLHALKLTLSSVRQNYLRLNSIPDAISQAEIPSLLQAPMQEVYLILTANDAEERLEEFYASTPFRLIQTFASVSSIINTSGDNKSDRGMSDYVGAIQMITDEVNLEIMRITQMKAKFGKLAIMPIIPVFAMGIIEMYFTSTIPGTSVVYKGLFGYLSRVLIILSSIIGYTAISKINSVLSVSKNDRSVAINRLLQINQFKNFVNTLVPKKLMAIKKKEHLINKAMSLKRMDEIYATKVIVAVIGFCFTLFVCYTSVDLGRSFIYDNVKEISLLGGSDLTKEDIEVRRRIDAEYLARPTLPSKSETKKIVEENFPRVLEWDREIQVERLIKKYTEYHNTQFKPWMVVLSFVVGIACWFIPEGILKMRKWILKTEAEEDILQLQTLIAILMNTPLDTLNVIGWMAKQSRVHKSVLIECYHSYPSNPEESLVDLKRKAPNAEFHRIIDKLSLTVHQLALREAFSDLVSEREQVMGIRKIAQTATIAKKRQRVSPLAMIPLALVVMLYVIAPIAIIGAQEFVRAVSSLNG